MSKLFLTQEIGSLPKPPWLLSYLRGREIGTGELSHLSKWSNTISFDGYDETKALLQDPKSPETETRIRQLASLFGVRYLEATGLDIVYDGEANRIEMYEHPIRNTEGFEFYGRVRSFDERYYRKAACVRKVSFKVPYHLDEFIYVAKQARRQTKIPVTGPYTLAEWSFNEYYQNRLANKIKDFRKLKHEAKRDFVLDLSKEVLRPNLEALARNGANWIQIDEPALATKPEEVPFFVEGFNLCTQGIECKFSVHICYSEYSALYPHILDLKNCSQLALEFANRDDNTGKAYHALELLNEYADEREVGLGVSDVHVDTIETPELIRDRILLAKQILGDPRRIYVNPDCGLRTRSWDVAFTKLRSIVEGARLARESLT